MTTRLCFFLALLALVGCRGCGDPGATSENNGETNNGVIVEPDETPDPVFSRICVTDTCPCTIGRNGGFCRTAHCGVTVQPRTVEEETLFIVTELDADEAIADEVLGRRTCEVEPVDAELAQLFQVSVYYDDEDLPESFREDEVVGTFIDPAYTLADEAVLEPALNRVSFAAEDLVRFAATVLPDHPVLEDELGLEEFPIDDPASYILNLSRHEFSASFHDGQRFYVANGPRVLIWNEGVPSNPTTPPDVVLGTPDLELRLDYASSENFGGSVRAIWSDGDKLAIVEGHRALIWNRVPTTSFTPADIVLGQDDFTSNQANRGGAPGPDTLASPMALASDGDRLIIAERSNHRFLVWNQFPQVSGEPADLVIGQQSFEDALPNAGQLPTREAWGIHFDGRRLALSSRFTCECFSVLTEFPSEQNPPADFIVGYPSAFNRIDPTTFAQANALTGYGEDGVALRNGHRVSVWTTFPTATIPADFTLGKPDDTIGAVLGRISASSYANSSPFGHVWSGEGYMFVGDGRRLLVYDGLPTSNFEPADLVIGQPGFATEDEKIDYRGITGETVAYATSVSTAENITVVADRANNRVLVLDGDPFEPKSVVVLGQSNAESFAPDRWGAPDATTLDTPSSVFTDGTAIFVADSGNHRVLVWTSIPTADGEPADLVLGQEDFASEQPNGGTGPGANTLHYPGGIHYDGSVYVADTYNHRVLVWNALPSVNGTAADAVVGQPDFESGEPNRGLGWYARDANTLSRPIDVTVADGGALLVSDSQNNRVMVFEGVDGDPAASTVLGQSDFTSDRSPTYHIGTNAGIPLSTATYVATDQSLRLPGELVWNQGSLYIADTGNHRVLRFDSLATDAPAFQVWGQPDFETRASNESAVSPDSLQAPEGVALDVERKLLVADTRNNRILRYPAGETRADRVFGQVGFGRRGTNGSSPAARTLEGPSGLAFADDKLWVADRRNHRVVAYQDGDKVFTLGQFDAGGDLPNAGQDGALGWTMSSPAAVWTDGTRLAVADRNNHRVLIWKKIPELGQVPADIVLGQPDRGGNQPNAGAGAVPNAASLLAPEGVTIEGDTVYVADTGNNRILVWESIPTANGVRADRVLCQSDMSSNGSNRGRAPTAGSCSNPTDVAVTPDGLMVADAGNHRILRFTLGADDGADANLVLGQPDFTTRASLEEGNTTSARSLSNPVRVDYDGRNFYVVDRGNHRVLVWDILPTDNFAPADRVIGQVDFETAVVTPDREGLESPLGLAVEVQPLNSARVWIADTGKNRVVSFGRVARPF